MASSRWYTPKDQHSKRFNGRVCTGEFILRRSFLKIYHSLSQTLTGHGGVSTALPYLSTFTETYT